MTAHSRGLSQALQYVMEYLITNEIHVLNYKQTSFNLVVRDICSNLI